MTAPTPEYRHSKCYANTRGGCSTSISGEHYISHALIRLYTFDDPDVRIQPTPNYRIPVAIQPKKFVANVLCAAHNNGLSDADRTALTFAAFLREIALRYKNGAGEWGAPEEVEISGDDFQRWVLKLLITHAAADVYMDKDGTRVKTIVPDEAIDLLLDRAMWPRTWGLGVTGDLSNSHLKFDPFTQVETATSNWWSAAPLIKHEPRLLFGGIVDLAGVSFTLCLFNQSEALLHDGEINPLRRVIQRPSALSWVFDGVPKTVRFRWSDPWKHLPITFNMRR
ncbi:hypothetical protein LQ384_23520 [Rhodococcus rhodochrous]|uniref:Uncharacterized protein n=1 Tax=Rhodococcus rhodochrous TaxID=1829 RepID=A0AAW4XMI0_RHORH|nr:hypothetical protein [Rhodococcus rhodochrous]MCD2114089.1 hypothetical protein [Rhodococcus rhodochrous]